MVVKVRKNREFANGFPISRKFPIYRRMYKIKL